MAAPEITTAHLQAIFENCPDGVLVADVASGQLRFANHSISAWLGYSTAELTSLSVPALHPSGYSTGTQSRFLTFAAGEGLPTLELHLVRKDGTCFPCDVSASRLIVDGVPSLLGIFRNVTGRRQAHKEMDRACQRVDCQCELLEAVLQPLPAGVILVSGHDWVVQLVNPAYQALCAGKEIVGRRFQDVWPESFPAVLPLLQQVLLTGEARHGEDAEFSIRRSPTGPLERAWFTWSVIRVRLPGDDSQALLITVVETTCRVQVEEDLRTARERLELALRAAGAGGWDWDLASGRLDWSPELFRLFGLDPDTTQASLQTWFRAMHPDDVPRASEGLERAVAEGGMLANEYRVLLPDGATRWINFLGRTFYDAESRPVRVAGICLDVTERKRAEQEVLEGRQRLELAASAAQLGIWDYDVLKDALAWDAQMLRIHGLTERPDSFGLATWRGCVHPDDVATAWEAWLVAMREERSYNAEFRVVHADGVSRLVRTSGRLMRDESRRPVRMLGTARDITEERALEERLRQTEKMDAVGRLAGGVAHDFNNQLTTVLGCAEMLLLRSDDAILLRYARYIKQAAERSAALTRQLLSFSRQGKVVSVPVDVHELLTDLAELLRRSIDKRIMVRLHLEASRCTVLGDPDLLQGAFLNLALNARDAMRGGGELLFSTREAPFPPGQEGEEIPAAPALQVCVTDSGLGMDAQTKSRIFAPFFTTKERGKGTGLGLASVHGAVRSHGGAIRVVSEPGQGSTFSVFLALAAEPPTGEVLPCPNPPAHARSGRIMVVDDEELVRQLMCDMLASLGHEVVSCGDPREALEIFARLHGEIDLVLLDVVMPSLSGDDVFRAMRAIDPHLKALLVSGFSLGSAAQRALEEGVLGYLHKPFALAELSRVVDGALHKTV